MWIKRTELEDKLLFLVFAAFRGALRHGKAAYCHVVSGVVRQIKVSRYRLRCIFVISFDVALMLVETVTLSFSGLADVYLLA